MTRRKRGRARGSETAVPRRKTVAAEVGAPEMRAANRMAREATAISAEVMAAAAKMRAAEAAASVAAVASAMAAPAPGNSRSRQRRDKQDNRNSYCPPGHRCLPATAPLKLWRKE
ncbi:MAG: hypothetical protein U1E61_22800 [Bradyrhizobium sp.]